MKVSNNPIQKLCSIKVEQHKVLLTDFTQDRSGGCFNYGSSGALLGDYEFFPPFFVILLVSNHLTDEIIRR